MGASGVSNASSVSSVPCVLNVFNALTALDVSSALGVLNALENEIVKSKVRRKPMRIIGFPRSVIVHLRDYHFVLTNKLPYETLLLQLELCQNKAI